MDDIRCMVMQLMRIPPGCQTRHIDNTKYRSAAFFLAGEGHSEFSYCKYGYFYYDDHDGENPYGENSKREDMADCMSDNSLCCYPRNATGAEIEGSLPKAPWFLLKNTGNKDFILFIVKINDFLDDQPPTTIIQEC